MAKTARTTKSNESLPAKEEIVSDYKIALMSRHTSLIGRKEVLSGKAKFGIFGDGKEIAQLAMARVFKHGDWRSGYYRDQTFMYALGLCDVKKFFAQLYADPDLDHEPASGGRQMNSHFATRFLDDKGNWLNQLMMYNSIADASPTGCQMSRLVGLGYASKLYRHNAALCKYSQFSVNGNEVVFGTIGNASTAEGVFWESMNAAAVLEIPMVVSVWDDDYGISVHNKYQMAKKNISKIMSGFQIEKGTNGLNIYTVKGWDYPDLLKTYTAAVTRARKHHEPALIHVIEITQPQGHSTSGSHERYKDSARLDYETSNDGIRHMRNWMIDSAIATDKSLTALEEECSREVERMRKEAWNEFYGPMVEERNDLIGIYRESAGVCSAPYILEKAISELERAPALNRKTILASVRNAMIDLRSESDEVTAKLKKFAERYLSENELRYNSHLHSQSDRSPLNVDAVSAHFGDAPESVNGSDIINECFDLRLAKDPRVFIIGEDVGMLGGVNSEFKGLQEKFGEIRVTDTGIREATIMGQGFGAAVRGLRPVVDIQYLDYLLYAFQIMSDDLATLHYRTRGGQIAPVIIRTKGHRLEGVWHTGSPLGMILHGSRGIHVCVPRNMVQAAGIYNTLFEGDDPALVIEVLNGYRLKEAKPRNLADFKIPLGKVEVLRGGSDVTVVSYGACLRPVLEAALQLESLDISCEVIDVQTLLPFDLSNEICASLEKTNAVIFVDEDVPGGASSYMLQQVLETQKGYEYLDAPPKTLTAKPHRSPYGTDGDYFSKPNTQDVVREIYNMMRERLPDKFPDLRLV
ncbi:MAG: thiamine pyrophosphate-dependent enzyme [Oligoflexales bacterium]